MNLAKYDQDYFDLEEFLNEMEYFEEEDKPVIRKMKKEEKYQKKRNQDKGKIREIKRNQENDYE